ncbi:DUF998 domain-containing protein [Micromonospora nigra]|uniref:DUF998 domain-containing protein n=1 Tax=Micromonospora nigra TaxID=145857 RepID=UPI0015862686|nr:DUF998 domain-containing protein [Micromonospora nigra]
MRRVPLWALLSAVAAPLLLIGGWTLAEARQTGGYDPVTDTISALAAVDADDRWIMTLGLVGLGLCHCVTAAGLRPLAPAGRLLLALGGVATVAVAATPLPAGAGSSTAGAGSSTPHALAAAIAFGALALWPALATRGARPRWLALTGVLVLAVGWFVVELTVGGPRVGLSERVAAGAEALCPLVVVLRLRLRLADA